VAHLDTPGGSRAGKLSEPDLVLGFETYAAALTGSTRSTGPKGCWEVHQRERAKGRSRGGDDGGPVWGKVRPPQPLARTCFVLILRTIRDTSAFWRRSKAARAAAEATAGRSD